MATTVKTIPRFSKLTPSEELMVRTLEGRPIPQKLKKELLRLKGIEKGKTTKTARKSTRKKNHRDYHQTAI